MAPRSASFGSVGERLKWLRRNGPLAQFRTIGEMCKHLRIGSSTWYDWISEKYPPKGYILDWLANQGVNENWLKTGQGELSESAALPASGADVLPKTSVALSELVQQVATLQAEFRVSHGVAYVRWTDDGVNGTKLESTGEYFAFADDDLRAIRIEGYTMDGMSPNALRPGETVLIRLGGHPHDKETWVVRYTGDDGMWSDWDVRGVAFLGEGRISLRPNNPLFEDVERTHQEVQFLGRVEYRIAEICPSEETVSVEEWVHVDDPDARKVIVDLLSDSTGRGILKDWGKLDDYGRLAVFGMVKALLRQ